MSTAVAMAAAVTAAIATAGSRVIAARNPKNAHPAATNSVSAMPLVQVGRSRVSIVTAIAIPEAQRSTIESARNARVRSRWRSHPSTVSTPRSVQAPPKAHDSTRVVVLKALPVSARIHEFPRLHCFVKAGRVYPVVPRTSMTASATWDVPTAVGSSRSGFMS